MADDWRVRILDMEGQLCGAGVLIPGNRILTTASVVAAAGKTVRTTGKPPSVVVVRFTTVLNENPTQAEVEHWVPSVADGTEGFAVLRLVEPPPGVVAAQVARIRPGEDRTVRAYGYPRDLDFGVWEQFEVVGPGGPRNGWTQLNRIGDGPQLVGFSGAGVVSEESGAVIGILVAADTGDRVVWMVSLDAIAEAWPPLASLLDQQPSEVVRRLVDAAMRIQVLHGSDSRDLVLAELPSRISGSVRRHPAALFDVTGIIRACLREHGGLRVLAEVLEFFEGGSAGVQDFRRLVDEIDPPDRRTATPPPPPSAPAPAPAPVPAGATPDQVPRSDQVAGSTLPQRVPAEPDLPPLPHNPLTLPEDAPEPAGDRSDLARIASYLRDQEPSAPAADASPREESSPSDADMSAAAELPASGRPSSDADFSVDVGDDDDAIRREVGTRGFGDRPTTVDALAREAYVATLVELIEHRPPEDAALDTAGPTVIAIEGSWGTGKSSLIEMVRARLTRGDTAPTPLTWRQRWRLRRLRAWDADVLLGGWHATSRVLAWLSRRLPPVAELPVPRFLTVCFNPWSYQTSEQVWAGLTDAIVRAADPAICPVEPARDRARERYWFGRNTREVDRRRLQRTLRQRIISPLLRLAVFALPVPILTQLVREPTDYAVGPWRVAPVDLALWTVFGLLGLGLLHTAWRYLTSPAATLLPGELFTRPVTTGVVATQTGDSADAVVHDPFYRARSGFLYLAQHDVFNLLETIERTGAQLIVCIDDLDRCSPRTTADVFEAINVFLSRSYPTTRFLVGLDSAAVSVHLDAAYEKLAASRHRLGSDPSLGWSFLRKLIQLPVQVPRTTAAHVEPVLNHLLGETAQPLPPVPDALPELPPPDPADLPEPAPLSDVVTSDDVGTSAAVAALEADERVRRRLAERLAAQPDLSVREAKRLLTIWQFYVRVLDRLPAAGAGLGVSRARHLVILAELVARWPAWQRHLHQRLDEGYALRLLAEAVDDDDRWDVLVTRLGLGAETATGFPGQLRELLRCYDGRAVAELAEYVT